MNYTEAKQAYDAAFERLLAHNGGWSDPKREVLFQAAVEACRECHRILDETRPKPVRAHGMFKLS